MTFLRTDVWSNETCDSPAGGASSAFDCEAETPVSPTMCLAVSVNVNVPSGTSRILMSDWRSAKPTRAETEPWSLVNQVSRHEWWTNTTCRFARNMPCWQRFNKIKMNASLSHRRRSCACNLTPWNESTQSRKKKSQMWAGGCCLCFRL